MIECPAGIITIEDSLEANSYHLIKHFTSKLKCNSINLVCSEKLPQKWKHNLNGNLQTTHCENVKEWKETLVSLVDNITDKSTTLIFDSINQLSLIVSWPFCLQLLKKIRGKKLFKHVIVLLHNDCLLNSHLAKELQYISHSYIKLTSRGNDKCHIDITTTSDSGKVKRSVEDLEFDFKEGKWIPANISGTPQLISREKEKLPEDLTSFKISVDDAALSIKNKMVLPYTQVKTNESKIIYHHDIVDDWDEEDPDDDLDI